MHNDTKKARWRRVERPEEDLLLSAVVLVCLAVHAEMRQAACDVGDHMNLDCGFVLSVLRPVDAPVREFDGRGVNRVDVAEFEARKLSLVHRFDKRFILTSEVTVHHPEELLHHDRISRAVGIRESVEVRRGDASDARQFLRIDF